MNDYSIYKLRHFTIFLNFNIMIKFSIRDKKVIIFDLDGTIVDLKIDWSILKKILSKRYSEVYKTAPFEFKHITTCLDLIVKKGDEAELKEIFSIISEYEVNNFKNSKYIGGAVFFIKNKEKFGIRRDAKLAIFSLNTRNCIIKSLKSANIHKRFDLIIGREDVRKWKPDPIGLFKIKEYFNVNKKEMIYIGDSETDLKTGKNARIETFLIDEVISLVRKGY